MSQNIKRSESKAIKKAKLLNEIRQGLKDVKDIREGKTKAYFMSDLFGVQQQSDTNNL